MAMAMVIMQGRMGIIMGVVVTVTTVLTTAMGIRMAIEDRFCFNQEIYAGHNPAFFMLSNGYY